MPPTQSSRFAPQHLSNPYAHLNPPSHLPQPTHHIPNAHQGFNSNVFTPASGNTQIPLGSAFNAGMNTGMGGGGGGGGGGGMGHGQGGFGVQGYQMQQRHGQGGEGGKQETRVREVWKHNLAQEMAILRKLIDDYPYVSMDTEFPGVVVRPLGEFTSKASYHYQTVRCNVDLLKLIQLGITLFSPSGDLPPSQPITTSPPAQNRLVQCPCTWNFNFAFSPQTDMCNEDSIVMLRKAGVDFNRHATQGISPAEFGSLLITSGLILNEDVHWISFHSGYDFAYIVKMLWAQPLPTDEESYRKLVWTFFPNILDVKFLLRHAQSLGKKNVLSPASLALLTSLGQKSGLQDLADELGCTRTGTQHQAGSDAWLTGLVFWAMKNKIFDGAIPDEMNGQMWGLTGVGAPASKATQDAVLANAMGLGQVQVMQQGINFVSGMREHGGPSTPTTGTVGLAGTSGPGVYGGMTPGAFGAFGYSK